MTSRNRRNAPELGAPFVGRERERAEIEAGIGAAVGGRGRLFLVRGEPGVGKTSLVEKGAEAAEARGFVVAWGQSQDAAGAPPYWPWTLVLRALREGLRAEGDRETLSSSIEFLARILPEIAPAKPSGEGATAAAESPDARFRLYESVTSYLASLATRRPLMVVIEDLHAADVSSLLLLQFAARELRQTPIVLVGTYREPGPWLDEERRGILARTSAEGAMLSVKGLTETEVSRLAEAVVESKVPSKFAKELHRATGGNALFVDGTLRMLRSREGGLLRAIAGRAQLGLEGGGREAIREWVAYLSPHVRDVVEAGAVLGEELAIERVARASGIALEDVDDLLEEAVERGIVSRPRRSPLRARFRHGLIRETLYDDLPPERRRELHRKIAAMLASSAEAADPAELAHHFLRAGEAGKAFPYSREAARRSLERFAWEDAIAQLRDALAALALAGDDPRLRCETLLDLAGAVAKAGDYPLARTAFAEAFAVARAIESTELMARAAIGHYGQIGSGGSDPETAAMVRAVLPRLDGGDHALRALLLGRLAHAVFLETSASQTHLSDALVAARRSGDAAVVADTLMTVWPMLINEPDLPRWQSDERTVASDLVELGIRHGNPEWQQWGRVYLFMEAVEEADIAAAEREAREVTAAAARLHQPFWHFGAGVLRTMLAAIAGRFEECLTLIDESAHQGRGAAGISDLVCSFQRAFVALELDRTEHLQPMIRFGRLYPQFRAYHAVVAHHLWQSGARDEGRRVFEKLAAGGLSRLRPEFNWATGAVLLAPVCADLDDVARAAELYELLVPYADRVVRIGVPGYLTLGPGARFLGMLATTAGRYEDAARHFAVSHEISRRMGARPWIAHTKYDEARLALRRGKRDAAAKHLAEGETIARELGMTRLLRKIGELAG